MVSLAYLFVTLAVLSAVAIADDVKSSTTEAVEEKWWGGGYRFGWGGFGRWARLGSFNYGFGCTNPWINTYGPVSAYGMFPYSPTIWFKEVASPANSARRSIASDNERIYRRDGSTVACKNTQGQTDHFVLSDCHQAVQALTSKKASSSNCKSCAVKLVTPQGQLSATGAPAEALQKVAEQILKSCASGVSPSSNHAQTRRSPADNSNSDTSKQPFAMIFQKGDGTSCDA